MRSCTLIDEHILIDLSPDIFAQKLRYGLRLDLVTDIVFTHSHSDHEDEYAIQLRGVHSCAIRPDVPPEEDYVRLYGNEQVRKRFEHALETKGVDPGRYRFHDVWAFVPFEAGGLRFTPLRANHRPIQDEDCLIYGISDGKASVLYANDTGRLSEENDRYLENAGLRFDLVSMDCSRGLLPGDGHMGWKEVLELRERLIRIGSAHPGTIYLLNHLSHMNNMTHSEWERFAAREGMQVAYDGLEIQL